MRSFAAFAAHTKSASLSPLFRGRGDYFSGRQNDRARPGLRIAKPWTFQRSCRMKMGIARRESIDHFQGELDLARWAGGPADDAEAAAADDVGGQTEINYVEDIEEFGAKLQDREFAVSAMAERGVLDQGHVKIAEAGGAKGSAAKRAETTVVRAGSPGDIDGDLKKGAVRRAQAEVILASGAAGGEIRGGGQVGAIGAASACGGLLDSPGD